MTVAAGSGPRARLTAAVAALGLVATLVITGSGTGSRPAEAVVDPTPVRVAVVTPDLAALVAAGVVPDLGDVTAQFTQLSDEVNREQRAGRFFLETHVRLLSSQPSPEEVRVICDWATREVRAFVVVFASVQDHGLARCIAVERSSFVLGNVGFTEQLYDEARGFVLSAGSNTSMSVDRQTRAWARLTARRGLLDGQTVGAVTTDGNPDVLDTIRDVLASELAGLGHPVAEFVVLPCASDATTCAGHDDAVTRLRKSGVTFVFNAADSLAGVELATRARAAGYRPTWTNNRVNTTDTVAAFYASLGEYWAGARGVSVSWPDADFTQETKDCNASAARSGAFSYRPDDNAYSAYGAYCILMNTIARGLKRVQGRLDAPSFRKALLALGTVPSNAGPAGTWSRGKYDAGDYAYAVRYATDANEGRGGFVPVGRIAKPVKIPR